MLILALETSCDETSVAIVENGKYVRTNTIASSVKDHEKFGGVVPEIAARRQSEFLLPVLDEALKSAKCTRNDIDAIAVTKGPGLLTSLIVGVSAARTIAAVWKKTLIGVHHMRGHLDSTWLGHEEEIVFPILTLSVSGGHTELWLRRSHTEGSLIGSTRDDAAGEAFDKGAKLLGLPYPGGPSISRSAENGQEDAIDFPRPLIGKKTLDYSFSGLKTALKYYLRDHPPVSDQDRANIAASYQEAILNHLLSRIELALEEHDVQEVHIVGGVSANKQLREKCGHLHVPVRLPIRMEYCTDNAAMIGAAAFFLFSEKPEEATKSFETSATIAYASVENS